MASNIVSKTVTTTLPHNFHDAVLRWKDTYLSDFDFLIDHWERYFPNDQRFRLCAYREQGMCETVECGDMEGQPKFTRAVDMDPRTAHQLLGAIKAQASTEFGSIQQHRLTLARAQDEQDQMWVLRMMAEELRHGYQMLHLLLDDDWSHVSELSGAEMVEEILSMTTGSHVLGAFNIDFDSFVDNVTFCCLIDRVGKYQLAMQKISAYMPMAESMPQMLREEAFHLATGVVPMRKWVQQAAQGEVYVTMESLQRAWNKWLPRGLEMFGDERGGGTNVRLGLKPMRNAEAQQLYYEELAKVQRDLNMRYLRGRLPELALNEAKRFLKHLEDGDTVRGVKPEKLLRLADHGFYRRRGVPAFTMAGVAGETFEDLGSYLRHLEDNLPQPYLASSDFRDYVDLMRQVDAGTLTTEEASRKAPALRRVGGSCPCAKSVRWVVDDS